MRITEGKVGKEVRDQANTPDVMSAPEHYGMHRHFTAAGSVVMFGGGIKKGTLYGKTADERPCTTIENPVPVEDLHATIYHALGIAPNTSYLAEKRPVYVTNDGKGKPIRELFERVSRCRNISCEWQVVCLSVITVAGMAATSAQSIPDKLVVLTFDDSKASHYTVVRPLLKKYGFGATFFITEGFTFRTNKEDYLTWEQIAIFIARDFEIGNHTRDHKGVSKDSLAGLREQVEAINAQCARYGIPAPVSFAYPGNAIEPAAFPILEEFGIPLCTPRRRAGISVRRRQRRRIRTWAAIIRCCFPQRVTHVRPGRWTISSAPTAQATQRKDCDSAVSWCARCRTSLGAHTARAIRGVHEVPPRRRRSR